MIIRAVLQVQQLRHRLADAKVTQQMIRRTRTQTQILTPPSPVLAQQHTAPFSGKNVKARMDPPVSNVVTMSTLGAALALSMGFVLWGAQPTLVSCSNCSELRIPSNTLKKWLFADQLCVFYNSRQGWKRDPVRDDEKVGRMHPGVSICEPKAVALKARLDLFLELL